MMRAAPIGIFDSGFGGLSVLRALRERLPAEDVIYCADHAFLPYGERDPSAVRARARRLGGGLVDAGAKAVVIACNTATAAAAETLRDELPVPVIGMEPAVKPAVAASRNGVIGVLGTGATLASARFAALLARYAGAVTVATRRCPELVTAAERRDLEPVARQRLVEIAVAPLLARSADVLVLGCTHFPFLRTEIATAAGPGVAIIDTGPAVAREVERRLDADRLRTRRGRHGAMRCWTTGDPASRRDALAALWGEAALEAAPVEVTA